MGAKRRVEQAGEGSLDGCAWVRDYGRDLASSYQRADRSALKMVPSCSSAELWHQTKPPTGGATEEEIAEMQEKKKTQCRSEQEYQADHRVLWRLRPLLARGRFAREVRPVGA